MPTTADEGIKLSAIGENRPVAYSLTLQPGAPMVKYNQPFTGIGHCRASSSKEKGPKGTPTKRSIPSPAAEDGLWLQYYMMS